MRIVIAGAGEVGRDLARSLNARGDGVVLIDRDADILAEAEEGLDVQGIRGDSAWRSVLARAAAGSADAVVAATGSDDANMLSAALAKGMGARVTVARVDDPGFYQVDDGVEQDILGVDYMLCSTRLVAAQLLLEMLRTSAVHAIGSCFGRLQVAMWRVGERPPLHGAVPDRLGLPKGVFPRAVVRDGQVRGVEQISRLELGDLLLMAGGPGAMGAAVPYLEGRGGGRRLVIVGGTPLGALLARLQARSGWRVDLVDHDAGRCRDLAAEVEGVRVIRGDATDAAFLRDARLAEADAVVAVTLHEEVNLLVSLLVRQEAPAGRSPPTYMAVRRPGYVELCGRLGLQGAASTYQVLANAMVEAIAPSGLVASQPLPDTAWSLAEIRLPKGLHQGTCLDDLPLPPGTLPLGVVADHQVCAPRPDLELRGAEQLVVIAPTRDVARIARAVAGVRGGEAAS